MKWSDCPLAGWNKVAVSSSSIPSCIDVAPTFLEVLGLPHPSIVNGHEQQPIEGVSLVYTFDSPNAPGRHETQYFEILGNRGIYHLPDSIYRAIILLFGSSEADLMTIYGNLRYEYRLSQAHDLAQKYPENFVSFSAYSSVRPRDIMFYRLMTGL